MAIHYIKPGIDANKLYDTINSLTGVSNTSEASESISYPNSAVKFDDELWKGKDGRFLFYHTIVVDSSTSPATHTHVFVPGNKYVEALGAFLTSSSWVAGGNTSLIGTINLVNQIDPSVTNSFYVGNSYKSNTGLRELFQNGIDNFVTSSETTFADASSFKMIKLDEVNLAGESLVDNLSPNAQSNQFIFVMWKRSNSNYCVNFNGGGGLSQQKLSKTTADPAEVLSGETFYSKDKNVKTGTLPHHPEHYKTISTVNLGDYLGYKIPRGGYTHAEPWVRAEKSVVAKAIGLTAGKIAAGTSVLGITGTSQKVERIAVENAGILRIANYDSDNLGTPITLSPGTYRIVGSMTRDSYDEEPGICGFFGVFVDGTELTYSTGERLISFWPGPPVRKGFGTTIDKTFTITGTSKAVSIKVVKRTDDSRAEACHSYVYVITRVS